MTSSKRAKSGIFVCKNSQQKEQECFFHSISCKLFNRYCLKEWQKTWLFPLLTFSPTSRYTPFSDICNRNSLWAVICKPIIHSFKRSRFPVDETFSIWEIKLNRRDKVKNSKKCNKELAALVKVMIDENVHILFEEMASTLNISSGSAFSILRNSISCCTVCAR